MFRNFINDCIDCYKLILGFVLLRTTFLCERIGRTTSDLPVLLHKNAVFSLHSEHPQSLFQLIRLGLGIELVVLEAPVRFLIPCFNEFQVSRYKAFSLKAKAEA